jgi:hypothetical protein
VSISPQTEPEHKNLAVRVITEGNYSMDNEDIKTFSRRKFLSSTTAAVAMPAV